MVEDEKSNRETPKRIDPEIAKIQDLKKTRLTQRARGGPPSPGPLKPANQIDAIAATAVKNAQDIQQLQQNFGGFAKQTEQNIMVTQRMVQNLARPDLILGPVIDQWHNGPFPHMILMVKEGMRIVAVGKIVSMEDIDPIELKSDQGIISIKYEHVLMIYKKEEGVLYGQARRDSEAAAESAGKSSDKPEDPSVEAEKD